MDVRGNSRHRRRIAPLDKAKRTATSAKGTSRRLINPGAETSLRARLGEAFARHDPFGHRPNQASTKRRRSERRRRASLIKRPTRTRCYCAGCFESEFASRLLTADLRSSGEIASDALTDSSSRPTFDKSRTGSPSPLRTTSRPVCSSRCT